MPVFSAPLPLAFECRLPLRRGPNEVPAFDRGNEIHLPVSGADAWCGLPTFVDGDRAGVVGHADPSRVIAVEEDPPNDWVDTSQFKILQDRFRQWWSVTGYVPKRMMQSALTTHMYFEWRHPAKHGRRVG